MCCCRSCCIRSRFPVIIAGRTGHVRVDANAGRRTDGDVVDFDAGFFFDVVFLTLALWMFEPLMTE